MMDDKKNPKKSDKDKKISDDGFDDDEAFDDADPLLEEEVDEQDWESYEAEEIDDDLEKAVVQRKKGLFSFNTIVILIAVVFGGAFIAMQLSKQAPNKHQDAAPAQKVVSTGLQMVGQKERKEFNAIDTLTPPPALPPEPKGMPLGLDGARQGAGAGPAPLERGQLPPMPGELASQADEGTPASSGALPAPGAMGEGNANIPVFEDGIDLSSRAMSREEKKPPASDVLTPLPDRKDVLDVPVEDAGQGNKPASVAEEFDLPVPTLPKADTLLKADKGSAAPEMPSVPVKKVETQSLAPEPPSLSPAVKEDAVSSPPMPSPSLTPEAAAVSATEIAALKDMLSALGERLDTIEKKVEAVSSTPSSESAGEDVARLKDSIGRIEAKLSSLSAQTPVSSERVQEEKVVRAAKAPVKSAVKRAAVRRSSMRSEEAAPVPSNGGLEIRAAQPGQAWVARPGDNDMQQVSVGDSLPGLGRITSIAQIGGKWVVQGSRGRLSQ